MRLGLPSLAFDREGMPKIDLAALESSPQPDLTKTSEIKPSVPLPPWWMAQGYNSINEAILSGNFTFDRNSMTWKVKPGATTPAMEQAADLTKSPLGATGYVEPNVAVEEAIKTAIPSGVSGQPNVYNTPEEIAEIEARLEANKAGEIFKPDPVTKAVETATGGTGGFGNKKTATQMFSELGDLTPEQEEQNDFDLVDVIKQLQVKQGLRNEDGTPKTSMIGSNISSDLGPLGTSGISMMEDEPITLVSDESPMSPSYSSETPSFETMKEAVKAALAATKQPVEKDLVRDDPVSGIATGYSGDGFEDQLEEEPSNVDVVKKIIDSIGTTATEESDIDKAVAAAVAAAEGDKTVVEKELAKSDPVQAAVDAAVGNGQPTTDDTILNLDDMTATSGLRDAIDNAEREESKNPFGFGGENYYSGEGFIPPPEGSMNTMAIVDYYNPSTGQIYRTNSGGYTAPPGWISGTKEDYESNKEYYDNILAGQGTDTGGTGTETQQPDFMTQLQELIASMQAEQTAAAEAAAAAEAERQKQTAEMTQNYMVGQPAVGYNPYVSGQYQSDPYGAAGVPDMGGITSIPVPTAYTPNPYLIGGTT